MNRPEGISPEVWEKAIEATNAIADEKPLGNRRAAIIARAIHSSVEAERAKASAVLEREIHRWWHEVPTSEGLTAYDLERLRQEILAGEA